MTTAAAAAAAAAALRQVADPSPLTVGDQAYIFYDGDDNRAGADMHAAIGMAFAHAGD